MAGRKRKFNRLPGVSKENDKFSEENNRRPFVFNITCADGSTYCSEGSVDPSKCGRLEEIFLEIRKLHLESTGGE